MCFLYGATVKSSWNFKREVIPRNTPKFLNLSTFWIGLYSGGLWHACNPIGEPERWIFLISNR